MDSSADLWLCFEGSDAQLDDYDPRPAPARTDQELQACRAQCLSVGYGGFVVKREVATFRPKIREELLEHRIPNRWEEGVLYVAPPVQELPEGNEKVVTISHATLSRRANIELLVERSGYFASLYRHDWADSGRDNCRSESESGDADCNARCASFTEFPGGERAFEIASSWLAADEGASIGRPWPILDVDDVCISLCAAAYLDAPELLRAAVRSWTWALQRPPEEILRVAKAMAKASLQFEGESQQSMIGDMRQMLQELPKHQLDLTLEFLASPIAGLAILEVHQQAKQTIVGHIKSVGGWVGSVIGGSSLSNEDCCSASCTPHDFAVRLFEAHQNFYFEHHRELWRLLRHFKPSKPISSPLCFRVAAAAASAATMLEGEIFAGKRQALNIFERGLASCADPAQAAASDACAVSLFGANGGTPIFELDVLGHPLVPPSASAVILSRVLSSWAAGECCGNDGANIILDAVATDRQHLKTMLSAVVSRISDDEADKDVSGTEWGNPLYFAVPELRAAFAHAAERLNASNEKPKVDETLRLLFQIVYRRYDGLTDVRFPLVLLQDLRSHNSITQVMVTRRVLAELDMIFEDKSMGFALDVAEQVVPAIIWESADASTVEHVVGILRELLCQAAARPCAEELRAQTTVVRLLKQLPLRLLANPLEALGPPMPAHVLAFYTFQATEDNVARIERLESENAALRQELMSLKEHRGVG